MEINNSTRSLFPFTNVTAAFHVQYKWVIRDPTPTLNICFDLSEILTHSAYPLKAFPDS